MHIDIGRSRLNAETDSVIYRLVQEGLTNAARHGAAKNAWVRIDTDKGATRIVVEDDGLGFTEADSDGMGLKGMRERLLSVSGSLSLGKRQGGGTSLMAVIPPSRAKEPA